MIQNPLHVGITRKQRCTSRFRHIESWKGVWPRVWKTPVFKKRPCYHAHIQLLHLKSNACETHEIKWKREHAWKVWKGKRIGMNSQMCFWYHYIRIYRRKLEKTMEWLKATAKASFSHGRFEASRALQEFKTS